MTNDCMSGMPGGESPRRFSAAYKQSLDRLEVSDAIRNRILSAAPQLAAKRLKHQWVKAVGGVAACLVAVVAAGSLFPRVEQFQLSVQDNGTCETVSSTAAETVPPQGVLTQSEEDVLSSDSSPAGSEVSQSSAGKVDSGQAGQETDGLSDASASVEVRSGDHEDGAVPESGAPVVTDSPSQTGGSSVDVPAASNGASPYGTTEQSSSATDTANGGTASNKPSDNVQPEEAGVPEPADEREEGAASVGSTTTAGGTEMPNPLTEYATAEEAFMALGWKAPLPKGMTGSYTVIAGVLFQLDTAEGGCYRVGLFGSLGEDVSGDYNTYAYDEQIEADGLFLRLRGENAGEVGLVSWTADGFSYSYASPTAMTTEEAINFAKAISG